MRARWKAALATSMALWFTLPCVAYTLRIRDSLSGLAVPSAQIDTPDGTWSIDAATGVTKRPPETVDRPLTVGAPGYQSSHIIIAAGADRDVTVMLDPLSHPAQTAACAGLSGTVIDGDSGLPIAHTLLEGSLAPVVADGMGRYCLRLPDDRLALAAPITLQLTAPGYNGLKMLNLPVLAGERMPLYLSAGNAMLSRDLAPQPRGTGVRVAAPARTTSKEPPTTKALPASVPDSIRVGFADASCSVPCCTGECSNTCVFSLETYVRRGLNDEWIASWGPQSLAAGAVAYRSFGAWHVGNPASQFFDVCSSSCCQVNDADSHPNSDAAVHTTAGILLQRNAQVFRAEYAAENNAWDDPDDGRACSNVDLSCGDGSVGSPALDWPCLVDDVGLGHGCFGHGRGMSQRGSHRWERDAGADWVWILDHYYNDSGHPAGLRSAFVGPVLGIEKLAAFPRTLRAGQGFNIAVKIRNAAAEAHQYVLLGASVRRASDPFIDDPAHDQALIAAVGRSNAGRRFVLPFTLLAGSYDLYVSVYLDVNQDGKISAADWRQDLVRVANYLSVNREKSVPPGKSADAR